MSDRARCEVHVRRLILDPGLEAHREGIAAQVERALASRLGGGEGPIAGDGVGPLGAELARIIGERISSLGGGE